MVKNSKKEIKNRVGQSSLSFLKKKALDFKWFIVFFVPFLAFQIFHIAQIQWDTTAYIFGGKWFCGNQIYFEFIRPPLPSFLNCLSGATDYSMIITTAFAAVIYLAALILIYSKNREKLSQFIFAAVAFLFPAILFYANFGSDLLALAFLLLAFAVAGPVKKGFFFGLATLSRYNFFVFIIVLLFELRKKPRDIVKLIIPMVLLWVPWMVYNYLFTGNPLFSVVESSYLNVQMKGIIAPFFTEQILILAAFFVILALFDLKEKLSKSLNQAAIINVVMFAFSGIKETRFMNTVVPALAFNSAMLARRSRFAAAVIFILLLLSLYFGAVIFLSGTPYANPPIPADSFIRDCRVASDKWVFFYYRGIVAETSYDMSDWNQYLAQGGSLVIYDYNSIDLNKFAGKVINRGDYVIIKSDSCAPQPKKYISGSLRRFVIKWLRDTNSTVYDYSDWVN